MVYSIPVGIGLALLDHFTSKCGWLESLLLGSVITTAIALLGFISQFTGEILLKRIHRQ